MIRRLMEEYDGCWDIDKWSNRPNRGAFFSTPVFSPIKKHDIKLFIELKWDFYKTLFQSGPVVSFCELRMFRESNTGGPPLEMEANFGIHYSDGKLLQATQNKIPFDANNLFNNSFDRARFELRTYVEDGPIYFTDYCRRLGSNKMTLTCHFKFYDYVPPKEKSALKHFIKMSQKISSMYDLNIMSDFEFVIGDKCLHAHKAVLAAHSPVFMNMLSGDFKESKTNTAVITDFTYETFDCFLRYLYSGDLDDVTWNTVQELYVLADKYDVPILRNHCGAIMVADLTVERISEVFKVGYTFNDTRLIQGTKVFCYKLPNEVK